MRFAVVVFPGSNCDRDMLHAITDGLQEEAAFVWHTETDLSEYDAVLLPGGFSHGDYLRAGAMGATAPIMQAVKEAAAQGKPVLGVCNGFQILLESGLLPGALLRNEKLSFICRNVPITIRSKDTMFTNQFTNDEEIVLPIAHGDGNYFCDEATYQSLAEHNQIIFTYPNNPNGSVHDIAGISNKEGNVLGMMPHPERAVEALLGSTDGLRLFRSILIHWREAHVLNA